MKEPVFVSVLESFQRLINESFCLLLIHHASLVTLHDLIEVLLHELEHEVEIIVDPNHLLQLDDVLMMELPQRFHFSEVHALVPREEFLLDDLNCNHLL